MRHVHGTNRCQLIPKGRLTRHLQRMPLPRITAFTIAWVLGGASLWAQQPKPTEYQVKAAYLYNFGRFVEWPAKLAASNSHSFAICVLGQDPFGPTLNATLADETINGKSVVAKRIPSPDEAVNCRILFISSSEEGHLKQILAVLDRESVLTVSDLPQFSRRGGMVQFVLDEKRVRFEINLTPAEHAGLTLSSELLKLATNVRRSAGD
jgi:hypothetical protein